MHVIALEDEPTSLRGGQELNLFEICQGLADRGHQITLIYEREGNLLEHYRKFCDQTVQVTRYGFDRRRIGQIVEFLPCLAKIRTLATNDDTVVLSNSCHPAFFGYLISFFRKLPLVCYIQTPSFDFNRQKRLGLNGVKRFITVSHHLKRYWMNLGYPNDKIEVVHNGTNLDKFEPPQDLAAIRQQWEIPETAKVICYVGRLDREKGLETLLKAFALLNKGDRDLRLLIAGKAILSTNLELGNDYPGICTDYRLFLEKLAADLGIEQQVKFLGHTTNTAALYQVSDVTAVPSIWNEPFGRVIIESMSCETPVVGSKVGGIPEILTEEFQNYLVEPGNEQDLAATIAKILDWRTTDPTLGQRSREYVLSTFSIDRMVSGIESALLEVTHA